MEEHFSGFVLLGSIGRIGTLKEVELVLLSWLPLSLSKKAISQLPSVTTI